MAQKTNPDFQMPNENLRAQFTFKITNIDFQMTNENSWAQFTLKILNILISFFNQTYAAAACIISTAQQAKPKVIGHNEALRAQFTRKSAPTTTASGKENKEHKIYWIAKNLVENH